MKIGEKIKALRKAKKISLTQLSKSSGVALATLSRIEHGKMTGTLESHLQISKALGINLTELYSDITTEISKGPLPTLQKEKETFFHNEKASIEILTSQIFSKKMLPSIVKLEAEGKTAVEQAKPGTEKFVFVLEGSVNLYIDTDKYSLRKGESFYLDGSFPHHIENTGKAAAKILCIITPPQL